MAMSQADNALLTQTGKGTPMGALFRRYWIPALLAREVAEPDGAPVRVQLLGEKLICFRDSMGRVGLVDEFCAHRGVSLWFGRNEECGLRCPYHGWKYDVTGQCVDLPSEPDETGMRSRIKLTAYPCIEKAGVIWAYMGPPELKPEPPAVEWTEVPQANLYISKRLQESNYLQAIEGGIDSSHVSFLHGGSLKRDPLFRGGTKANTYNENDLMPHFEIAEFDGGLLIGARRNADDGRYYWRITPWIAPFHTIIPPRGGHPLGAHAWVPIDDEHCWTWSINYHPRRALTAEEIDAMDSGAGIHVTYVPGTFIPAANKTNDYLMDRATQKSGERYSGIEGIAMQDASLQESMGPITDRGRENLVSTDNGIIMTRRWLQRAMKANAEGKTLPSLAAASQRVRSCSIELPKDVKFAEGAKQGLFAPVGSDPVSV
jgi:phenylpropionate dioxygenase-like ring-hydroxylating dioxygenase large terminal subunit